MQIRKRARIFVELYLCCVSQAFPAHDDYCFRANLLMCIYRGRKRAGQWRQDDEKNWGAATSFINPPICTVLVSQDLERGRGIGQQDHRQIRCLFAGNTAAPPSWPRLPFLTRWLIRAPLIGCSVHQLAIVLSSRALACGAHMELRA